MDKKELVNYLLENDVRLYYIDDEEPSAEVVTVLGDWEVLDTHSYRDNRWCVEEAIVHFPHHGLYIKEVASGPCHYRDIMIDGGVEELDFYEVEPKSVTTTSYIEKCKI